MIIKGLTKAELKEKLLELVGSGVALHEQTVADVLDVASFIDFAEDDIELVKNKEVKAALYDYFGIVPGNPTEFLRYVVYRSTNKTLLIKNKGLTTEIAGRDNLDVARYFDLYEKQFGLARLAEIFYRFKPIFLAFRTNPKLKRSINKIRRLAVANHKPMREDVLNSVTASLKGANRFDEKTLDAALEEATVFRKIRLAYALKFRTTDADSIMYRVRNGKSYAKEFSFKDKLGAKLIYKKVMRSITADIEKNVAGKKIFIPEGLKYGLPATEKQFTGQLPSGTYIELTEDLVAGIHWENQKGYRVDLDLSIQNAEGKIGWDGAYRNDQNNVHFSGDVTDAPTPKGASELFHIGSEARGCWMMFVNFYNYSSEYDVPMKIVVAHEHASRMEQNYTLDPNNIVAMANTSIKVKQKTLGFIVADGISSKFYFAESELGKGNSVRANTHTEQARKFLLNYYTDSIVLNDVLVDAGAEIVTDPKEADIDLSPETIDKTSILNLLKEVK